MTNSNSFNAADGQSDPETDDKSWLRTPLTDPNEIADRYDQWAATYDVELGSWHYDAPSVAAHILCTSMKPGAVLDVGCGTGLTGAALAAFTKGPMQIDGIDLSTASLEIAKSRGVYRVLKHHDFNVGQLPFMTNAYAAAECVGVLSYAKDPIQLLREISRVVEPSGMVVFSHRSDLWDSQNFPAMLSALIDEGHFADATWTEPAPYMPGNPDFSDKILVRYATAVVGAGSTT
jgi:predicted TPR repeat methyltransferase